MQGRNSIFVAGCMRSGTTVLQSVLCSTDEANPLIHECDFLIELAVLYRRNVELFEARNLKHYFASQDALLTYMSGITVQFLEQVRNRYYPAQKLVLKNPEFSTLIPTLHKLLPQAKFVISVRDPRDTIASMLTVADKLRLTNPDGLIVGFGRDMEKFCNYYNAIYAEIFVELETNDLFANNLKFIKYEDICSSSSHVINELAAHCNMNLSNYNAGDKWRSKIETDNSVWGTPLWGSGLSSSSIGNYKNILSKSEIQIVETKCEKIFKIFDYL